jgi:signal transduction histidine kinase
MRLADFTHLMATAISSVQLRGLAESQGALRRVATLVAKGAEPEEVFAAVAVEASRILGVGAVSVMSYDAEAEIFTKIFGTHGDRACVPDGEPVLPEDCPEGTIILETGTPVRIDDWTHIPGPIAARHREQGFGQGIAAPIIINGSVWGHIGAYGEKDEVLPFGCEMRLADFTQLMASAIANAKARFELRALAERQGAALRRVATLVAQQSPAGLIYNAVAREASLALGVQRVDLGRCHKDGSITLLGTTRSDTTSSHREFSKVGEYVAHEVKETERPARIDDCTALPLPHAQAALKDGVHAAVGGPIRVDGALWGVIVAFSDEPVGDDIETRLSDFTHLVASSISNVHARNLLIASRSRIVAASDETRRRIERNLHDGIQQKLVALGLDLNTICDKSQLPESVQSALEGVARDLEDVVEEIRVFSNGLHPALLSRSGLGPSLRALARRSAMRVDVVVPVDLRFPEPIETAVYYVASEALANATKHAYASKVSITVAATSTELRTMVSDDGVGGATMGKGSGLIGLVDRVEALGGSLTLDSPLKHGTELTIVLPLGSPELSDPPAL